MKKYLVALGILLVTALASANSQHESWVAAAFSRVPVSVADRQPERADLKAAHSTRFVAAIAKASERAPLPPRTWAALLLTLGGSEANFDTDVVEGRCKPFFCDMTTVKGQRIFRAKGAFQNHDIGPVHDIWARADGEPELQVEMADRVLRRSLARCAPFAPFPAHVFRAYKGGGDGSCSWALKDEQRRVALFQRLMSTPKPAGSGT